MHTDHSSNVCYVGLLVSTWPKFPVDLKTISRKMVGRGNLGFHSWGKTLRMRLESSPPPVLVGCSLPPPACRLGELEHEPVSNTSESVASFLQHLLPQAILHLRAEAGLCYGENYSQPLVNGFFSHLSQSVHRRRFNK